MIFALSLALYIACLVPALIPEDDGTTIKADSHTLKADSHSPVKSKIPGTSIKLILQLFHSIGTTDRLTDDLRLISSIL